MDAARPQAADQEEPVEQVGAADAAREDSRVAADQAQRGRPEVAGAFGPGGDRLLAERAAERVDAPLADASQAIASRSLRATAATSTTVTTVTTSVIRPISHTCSLPCSAGRPRATQRMKRSPGAANTSASVSTLTLTVAPANRSVLTPQLRRTTYWVAVPDGPGTTLLTADDDSRAMSERTNERPGMTGGYAAASSSRMTRAATSSTVNVRTDIELIAVHTPSRLPRAGTMTRNSRTSNPPESAALSTFISTDVGPGRSPRASPGSAEEAPDCGWPSSSDMGER